MCRFFIAAIPDLENQALQYAMVHLHSLDVQGQGNIAFAELMQGMHAVRLTTYQGEHETGFKPAGPEPKPAAGRQPAGRAGANRQSLDRPNSRDAAGSRSASSPIRRRTAESPPRNARRARSQSPEGDEDDRRPRSSVKPSPHGASRLAQHGRRSVSPADRDRSPDRACSARLGQRPIPGRGAEAKKPASRLAAGRSAEADLSESRAASAPRRATKVHLIESVKLEEMEHGHDDVFLVDPETGILYDIPDAGKRPEVRFKRLRFRLLGF